MAKRRKKPQPVVMPKQESNVMTITVDVTKLATGHQPHISGTGVHADKRFRRARTRSAQRRRWLAEQR